MAEEKHEGHTEEVPQEKTKKGGSKKLLIIILCAALALGGGIAYFMLSKGKAGNSAHQDKKEESKSVLVALDPFVLNLADYGRFLKVTIQLEVADPSYQQSVTEKVPQLRDAVITLISSKSAESVSSAEGKFQLKDELLLRANQAMGKDVFKNLYFTEFVMQ